DQIGMQIAICVVIDCPAITVGVALRHGPIEVAPRLCVACRALEVIERLLEVALRLRVRGRVPGQARVELSEAGEQQISARVTRQVGLQLAPPEAVVALRRRGVRLPDRWRTGDPRPPWPAALRLARRHDDSLACDQQYGEHTCDRCQTRQEGEGD